MQTVFANTLVQIAKEKGLKIVYINKDADTEVEQFFKSLGREFDDENVEYKKTIENIMQEYNLSWNNAVDFYNSECI